MLVVLAMCTCGMINHVGDTMTLRRLRGGKSVRLTRCFHPRHQWNPCSKNRSQRNQSHPRGTQ